MTRNPDVEWVNSLDLDDARGVLEWVARYEPEVFRQARRVAEDARRRREERAEFRKSLRRAPGVPPGLDARID